MDFRGIYFGEGFVGGSERDFWRDLWGERARDLL